MQVRKTRALGVDSEHRALARTAAILCCAIQNVTRYNHGTRESAVCVARKRTRRFRKTMQRRENLRRHLTSQYQAETGDQPGKKEQIFNARFHWLIPSITDLTGKTAACRR